MRVKALKKYVMLLITAGLFGIVFAYWPLKLYNGSIFNLIGFISIVISVLSVIGCIIIGTVNCCPYCDIGDCML